MHTLAGWLFLLQLTTTLCMTGLIWFVQVVHYPLFTHVGEHGFTGYAQRHATRTGFVVGAPMVLELASAGLGAIPRLRAGFVSPAEAITSFVLVMLIWAMTGLLQVPQHERLGRVRDARVIAHLVRGNWIRTIAWSLRSALLLLCLHRIL